MMREENRGASQRCVAQQATAGISTERVISGRVPSAGARSSLGCMLLVRTLRTEQKMERMIVFVVGAIVGVLVYIGVGRFSTLASAAGVTAATDAPQVVRCTNEKDGYPFDTSADDHWALVPGATRTFQSTHGKYFFAPSNHECVVISAPARPRS